MCIFRRYGRVSEGQQRHRRQAVLRRLERKELEQKHTSSRVLRAYSQVGMYKGYPKRRHLMYVIRLQSPRLGTKWINERKIGRLIVESNAWLDLGGS